RRRAAREGDHLDHAGPALRARTCLALRTGEHLRPQAGQGLPVRVHAARLDAARPRPARFRAATLPAPAGLWNELRDGQVPARRPDARAGPAAWQGLHDEALFRRDKSGRHDPGVHDSLAAHRSRGRKPRARDRRNQVRRRVMKNLFACLALALAIPAFADTTLDYNVLYTGTKAGAQKVVIGNDG